MVGGWSLGVCSLIMCMPHNLYLFVWGGGGHPGTLLEPLLLTIEFHWFLHELLSQFHEIGRLWEEGMRLCIPGCYSPLRNLKSPLKRARVFCDVQFDQQGDLFVMYLDLIFMCLKKELIYNLSLYSTSNFIRMGSLTYRSFEL